MKDKKSFGLFIAERRKEKNMTQAELAEKLYVTKTAVSKWERGVSYPDITLISGLCAILDVDEHELIAEKSGGGYQKIRTDAKKYRVISNIYFYGLCIAYALALVVCFICNLAVNKTLSWFFIVLTALCTAFTLFPSVLRFVGKYKLFAVVASFTVALSSLLLACCIYSGGRWFLTAFSAVILGVICVFLPIFFAKYPIPGKIKRHAPIICVTTDLFALFALLIVCLYSYPQNLRSALLLSLYCFAPVYISVITFGYLKINGFIKSAITCTVWGIAAFFCDAVSGRLFGYEYRLSVDLFDWSIQYINGNMRVLLLCACLTIAAFLGVVGIFRSHRRSA